MFFVCHVFLSVHLSLVDTCWERADRWLSCIKCLSVLCYFPMWCPGSGVALDCIDSSSLHSFLLSSFYNYKILDEFKGLSVPTTYSGVSCLVGMDNPH